MIHTGICDLCGETKIICRARESHPPICAKCLRKLAHKAERHQQQIAAASREIPDSALRVFNAMIVLADETNDAPMTLRQIASAVHRAHSVMHVHIDKLVKAGLVKRDKKLARTIRLVREPQIGKRWTA